MTPKRRPPFGRSPGIGIGRHKIPLRERFVEEYLIDLNATQAATRAGYSSKTAYAQGHRLLKDPRIAVAISAAAAARSVRVEVTQDYVLETAVQVVERCMERAPVMERENGEMVQKVTLAGAHVWQFDSRGAIAGLGLLAKHVGLGERPNININVDLDQLTDAQLQHLAQGGSVGDLPS